MEMVWIVVGVCYILYKLQQEEKIFTAKSILIILGVVGYIFIPWFVCRAIFGDTVADIVSVITFGIPMFILCIHNIIIYFNAKRIENEELKETEKDRAELDRLRRMSDEELSNLLGVPLNSIPLDGLGYRNRRECAIAFILQRKGLKYYRDFFTKRGCVYSEYRILETDGGKAFLEYIKSKGIIY